MPKKRKQNRQEKGKKKTAKKQRYPPVFINIPKCKHAEWEKISSPEVSLKVYRYSVAGALRKLQVPQAEFARCLSMWQARNDDWMQISHKLGQLGCASPDPSAKVRLLQEICRIEYESSTESEEESAEASASPQFDVVKSPSGKKIKKSEANVRAKEFNCIEYIYLQNCLIHDLKIPW